MEETIILKKEVIIKIIIGLSLAIPGLIIMIHSLYQIAVKIDFITHAIKQNAIVISIDSEDMSYYNYDRQRTEKGSLKYPRISFVLDKNEKKEISLTKSMNNIKIGDTISIFYNPNNSDEVEVDYFTILWGKITLKLFLAIIFLLLGSAAIFIK